MALSECRYDLLAGALDYPTEQTQGTLAICLAELRASCPQAAGPVAAFEGYFADSRLETVQEVYTQTFDLNAVCTLGVSYHLFGEDYRRGLFLARLRQSLREVGVEEGCELPDHLPVVLRWLGRVHDTELYSDMLRECVLPALGKMDESLADGTNPYRGLLQAIRVVLEQDLNSGVARQEAGVEAGRLRQPSG